MKNLKLISTILLSIMLIFTISTVVFADDTLDDDIWSNVNVTENATLENEIENEIENELENEIEIENEIEEENEYNNLYTTTNSTTSNSQNLADTGIGNSNTIVLLLIVGIIVAIYSAKKFNDYKNV